MEHADTKATQGMLNPPQDPIYKMKTFSRMENTCMAFESMSTARM